MEEEKAIVCFLICRKDGSIETHDLEIPLGISTNELLLGLNKVYKLGIEEEDINNYYLSAERPITLLRGNKKLKDYHLMNGTRIKFTEGAN